MFFGLCNSIVVSFSDQLFAFQHVQHKAGYVIMTAASEVDAVVLKHKFPRTANELFLQVHHWRLFRGCNLSYYLVVLLVKSPVITAARRYKLILQK